MFCLTKTVSYEKSILVYIHSYKRLNRNTHVHINQVAVFKVRTYWRRLWKGGASTTCASNKTQPWLFPDHQSHINRRQTFTKLCMHECAISLHDQRHGGITDIKICLFQSLSNDYTDLKRNLGDLKCLLHSKLSQVYCKVCDNSMIKVKYILSGQYDVTGATTARSAIRWYLSIADWGGEMNGGRT